VTPVLRACALEHEIVTTADPNLIESYACQTLWKKMEGSAMISRSSISIDLQFKNWLNCTCIFKTRVYADTGSEMIREYKLVIYT
jgi:hypothetical protein